MTMIDWLIFIPACFALNLAFGPNNLLAMTHGAKSGVGFAQTAALGRLLVFIPMIALSALGLGVILTTSAFVFSLVKFIGAAYLIWLGISIWRSAKTVEAGGFQSSPVPLRRAIKSEALVAVSNPKAILIFAAFFPQFVAVEAYWQSYVLLGAAFLLMEAIAICAYATFGKLASSFAADRLTVLQRVSGATMFLFGVLLLLSPHPTRS
ncbi:lysine transporter LysE [Sulfitobacter donghicola DSW-25 = KCTC 12864 = JCM 14565]|uniref:Lysine transporter LysE n=1 Tax=Sulfitobacter donghicola DSW-25 = KCTC 12864 = JCM 14565 TaxID=1300350 RepID=A0A073IF42_9RHOB|nr:lysine transporter LysE [Sulfitobacter donghicola DSW-25 = KCTC 12864 = JCM 14565]